VPAAIHKLKRDLAETRESLGDARAKLADRAAIELVESARVRSETRVVAAFEGADTASVGARRHEHLAIPSALGSRGRGSRCTRRGRATARRDAVSAPSKAATTRVSEADAGAFEELDRGAIGRAWPRIAERSRVSARSRLSLWIAAGTSSAHT